MSRAISEKFLSDLKDSKFLTMIQRDNTLDLELRGRFVEVYYRGCAIMKINQYLKITGADKKYFERTGIADIPALPTSLNDHKGCLNYVGLAKLAVDIYCSTIKKNNETEAQQRIVYENNISTVANDTDYFIIDIEYKNELKKEFDIVALKWASDQTIRRFGKDKTIGITIFELKYGQKAIGSSSKAKNQKSASMSAHMKDYNDFIKQGTGIINDFKKDMLTVFVQKCELGLVSFGNSKNKHWQDFVEFDKTKGKKWFDVNNVDLQFGYVFANYKKASTFITEELAKFSDDFLVMDSSFMGYGLYLSNQHYRKYLEDKLKI